MCAGYEATRKGCMEGTLYQKILQGDEAISIVGLGYVGLPIAVAFAEKGVKVIGFDVNREKIGLYWAPKKVNQINSGTI